MRMPIPIQYKIMTSLMLMVRETNEENTKPVCPQCKNTHVGECMKGSRKFFECGESGHIRKNCLKVQEAKEAKESKNKGDNIVVAI